ncbi:glycosyltransferase family 4 protein [Leptolyngbya sp. DQ-M1]|uniref:glycosyltransferase family 4 protein n=1 Tax=Leptolyngbya sp. DQ-M1 TaxID=2933920 RepID=UPI00329774D6
MNVLYDGKIYDIQSAGGINRYFTSIISRLPNSITPTITYSKPQFVNFPSHSNLQKIFFQRGLFRPTRVCDWAEVQYFRAIKHLYPCDLLHPTYYSLLTNQDFKNIKIPLVLTVYDLIHEIFFPTDSHVAEKCQAIQAAQAIICISHNTKKDLLERYDIPDSKIAVTHLASDIDVSQSYGSEPVPEQPYFLFVGSRSKYKNFDKMLSAFAKIAPHYSDLKLCAVGRKIQPWEKSLIEELNLSDHIEHYEQVSDCHLAKLYRCSLALVYPSRYEGFGIPPLEAMSCHSAVIAGSGSSIPEVVGDAGLLIDPESIDDLVEAMKVILNYPGERDRLIAKGQERARTFNWDKTAAETIEVYHSILG